MLKKLCLALIVAGLLASAGCQTTSVDNAGVCEPVPLAEPTACTMEYRPRCGCDGKTYSNACVARSAGVTEMTEGACEGAD